MRELAGPCLRAVLGALGLVWSLGANALMPIELMGNFERIDTRHSLETLVDESAALTLGEVQAAAERFAASGHTRFAPQQAAIWTRLALHNATADQRSVLLMNPSPHVHQIDIHVVRQDDSVESYALGSHRSRERRTLPHRYDVQPISLDPGEQVLVYTRHQSARSMDVDTVLYMPNAFLRFVQRDALSWGLFTGLVAALVLYNMVVGMALRQRVFLFYVLHGVALFAFTLTMNGADILVWVRPVLDTLAPAPMGYAVSLSVAAVSRISHSLLLLVTITASLFGSAFFDLPRRSRVAARLVRLWLAIAASFVAAEIASALWPSLDALDALLAYLVFFFLLCWLALGVFAALRRYPGWQYYLAGTGSFTVLALLQDAEWLGLETGIPDWISAYGTPVGLTLELSMLSLALGQRIRRLAAEHDASERLLVAQAKFSSVGQLLAGVVHQLKRPVIYAGTQLMKLEALMDRPPAEREAELPKALTDMRATIDFMDKTIVDLYRFYSDDKVQQDYHPAEQIEHVVSMLTPMTTGSALRIERDLLPEVTLHGYANAFGHAMMIVLENAAQVLKDRAVPAPLIRVGMAVEKHRLLVIVTDNGGGIAADRLERIFELYAKAPSRGGLGIGLALARRMIVERLQGSIRARNVPGGAEFTIRLPLSKRMAA